MIDSYNATLKPQSHNGWKVAGVLLVIIGLFVVCLFASEFNSWSTKQAMAEAALKRKNFPKAKELLSEALVEGKKAHIEVYYLADILSELGEAYEGLHDYKPAETYYLESLALVRKSAQSNSADLIYALDKLAVLYWNQDRYLDAKPMVQEILSIEQRTLGPNDPELAEDFSFLGNVYFSLEDYKQAEPYFKQALAINTRILKPNDKTLARNLLDLGVLYLRIKQSKLAEPFLNQAHAIDPDLMSAQGYRDYMELYRHAAQGNAIAQNDFGMLQEEGRGIEKNYAEAFKWYSLSAAQGNQRAQYNLALLYKKGLGIAPNNYQAAQWLEKSARQGYANAQFLLALMYNQEQGGYHSDPSLEFQLYLAAAKQGHHGAEYMSGFYYKEGYGVKKDLLEAKKWMELAAAGGFKDAAVLRDEISKQLNQNY